MMPLKPTSCCDVCLVPLSLTLWSIVLHIGITIFITTTQYIISLPEGSEVSEGSRGFTLKDYWIPPAWSGIAFHMMEKSWTKHNDICRSEENFTAAEIVTPGRKSFFLYNHASESDGTVNQTQTKTHKETKIIVRLLNQDLSSVFVDVGAGIGAYSLGVGATKRHKVISIEPLPDNARRLCRGIIASGLRWRNYIVTNALHSSHTDLALTTDEIAPEKYTMKSLMTSKNKRKQDIMSFSILLDDLLTKFNLTVAGLRIPATHHPDRILKGGKAFFKKVVVRFVHMEWRWNEDFNGKYICLFLTDNGMLPYAKSDFDNALKIEDHYNWPSIVIWKRRGP